MSTLAQGLRTPVGATPWMRELATVINTSLLRKEAAILGNRVDGTTWYLRFRAGLVAPWVQVHVQSTETDEGGLTYDANNFRSSTEVDCRSGLVQDVAVGSLVSDERYVVFLVPVQYDGAGLKVLYDGVAAPDAISFAATHLAPVVLSLPASLATAVAQPQVLTPSVL